MDYLLKPQVLAAAERHIRAANLSRIVLIDNLQHVIEVENPPAEKIAELQNRKGKDKDSDSPPRTSVEGGRLGRGRSE